MMRIVKTGLVGLAMAIMISAPAMADDGEGYCTLYSAAGGAMVDFMLPLTVQELVNMMSGQDEKLINEMGAAMISGMSPTEIMSLATLDPAKAEIMGQAAGETAMQLLMSGQVTNKAEVKSFLSSTCSSLGAETIMANQRKSIAATNANMGK